MQGLIRDTHPAKGRAFIAGDIHGQYDTLMDALKEVGFDRQRDVLYQVGDLIDRGADSYRCLSLAFEPWFRGVWGNHEQLAWDALTHGGNAWETWLDNGGSWIYLEDAGEIKAVLGESRIHLPLAREITIDGHRLGLVHAEPPWDWQQVDGFAKSHREHLIWSRKRFTQEDHSWVEGIDGVIVGHTIVDQPTWRGNVLHIDTGAFTRDGSLTLLALDDVVKEIQRREAAIAECSGGHPLRRGNMIWLP